MFSPTVLSQFLTYIIPDIFASFEPNRWFENHHLLGPARFFHGYILMYLIVNVLLHELRFLFCCPVCFLREEDKKNEHEFYEISRVDTDFLPTNQGN